jgi:prevent-host-death family protein
MDITKDIQPMTTFRNHSAEIMEHLRQTQRPMVLTVNGKAAAVIQDAEAYQRLVDLAALGGAEERRPALEVFEKLQPEREMHRGAPRNLAASLRALVEKYGGIDLPEIPREAIREPPDFSE